MKISGQTVLFPILHDAAWMRANAHRTVRDLAAEVGCSHQLIKLRRDDLGIEAVRSPGGTPVRYPELVDERWLAEHDHLSHREATALVGCSLGHLRNARQEFRARRRRGASS